MRFLASREPRPTDSPAVDLSVLIPTRGRPRQLAHCLALLADQSLDPHRYEVVVGLDGPDPDAEAAARAAWGDNGGLPDHLVVVHCPGAGLIDVRRRLLGTLRGRLLVSLNDDVLPEPALLDAHLDAQHASTRLGRPVVCVGRSPFTDFPDPTVFDALVAETSMVFFYDTMDPAHPDRDWGFRHCFGLNFSARIDHIRAAGGFADMPDTYGYEDIELGWRLAARTNAAIIYRPEARAPHEHRYRPPDILRREFSLGVAAWRFAQHNPAFARDTFGPAELDYSREFVAREHRSAAAIERTFLTLDRIPASAVDGPDRATLLDALYQQHLLLKRYVWRQGLLDEAEGTRTGYAPLSELANAA